MVLNLQGEDPNADASETPTPIMYCTAKGAFESLCQTGSNNTAACFCLHAKTGNKEDESPHVVQGGGKPDCSKCIKLFRSNYRI